MSSHPEVAEPSRGILAILSAYGSLFVSFSTLFCCALPALLILLGFGFSSVLTFFIAIPGWEQVGIYEMWLFAICGGLLTTGFYLAYFHRPRQQEVCEISVGNENACSRTTRWNRRVLWLSSLLFVLALVMNFWGIAWMKAHGYFNH
jgi:mercuric ion transport protein